MQIPSVDLKAQYSSIKDQISFAMDSVIRESAFVAGKYASSFEQAFAQYIGEKYCIGVGNGTDAIFITLKALGLKEGDEVVTVANSFIATSEAVTMTGARVVFVDCDPRTYNIDVAKIEKGISDRTKAIIPVHLYGLPAEMGPIMEVAKKYGLYVIEDAAQAHGAEIDGVRAGRLGHAACFSFYPGKNLGAYGDAGAIVTKNEELAVKCRMIANHGRIKKYDHEIEGLNSRLDGLQAAILRVKLDYLNEWNNKRRNNADLYRELLRETDVVLPTEMSGFRHVYHQFVIRTRARDAVQAYLKEKGIETGIHYPIALPNLAAYAYLGHTPADFPTSTQFSKEILSLPMFPELTTPQIEYVCEHLIAALESQERRTGTHGRR